MQISIYRQFWQYTIPTVAAMLVNGLYQVVDGIFIGRYVAAEGLAGINLAWPIIASIIGIGMLLGVGTGALVSIRQGEGDISGAKKILSTGLLLLLILTPVVAAILYFFSPEFLRWQGADGEAYRLGLQYLHVLSGACLFTLGSIAMPFFLRNDANPNLATILMIIGAVINIALDYLMIAVWRWELTGAAFATAIAQAVVTLLGLVYFFSAKANLRLNLSEVRLSLAAVPQIFAIGASSFFMYVYGAVMVAVHNNLFAHYGDVMMIGAYAILGYIVTVYYLTVEGVANGMQPLVSFNHGACNTANIRALLRVAITTSVTLGIAFVLMINLFPREAVSVFNSADEKLIENTILGFRLHLFALFLDGFLVVVSAYYQAVNNGSKAMFVNVGNMLVQLPFLYLMPKWFGVLGVWIAYPLSNIALSAVVIVILLRDLRRYSVVQINQKILV